MSSPAPSPCQALPCMHASVVGCVSVAGAGSLPGLEIPSVGVSAPGDHAAALRRADPPVVARVSGGSTICDLRTVDPADDLPLASALATALAGSGER